MMTLPRDEADLDEAFRRHAADALILAGGGAAILLQLADPRVARGVARHSAFREDPMQRLFGTLDYVYAVASGDEALVREVVEEVNARHRPVRGPAAPPGPAYSAFDRDAQRFVASTLAVVGLTLEERLGGPLPPELADGFVQRYGRLASALQGGPAGWPDSREEFAAWWAARLATLNVTDEARQVARTLLTSPDVPLGIRLGQPVLRLVTAALLPEPVRAAYGFRWTRRVERVASGWLFTLRVARHVVPAGLRSIPMRRSIRRLRRRVAATAER